MGYDYESLIYKETQPGKAATEREGSGGQRGLSRGIHTKTRKLMKGANQTSICFEQEEIKLVENKGTVASQEA